MAAKALRAARASPDPWRQTCFGVAAFYKRLALDDEILKGERQRSGARVVKTMPPRDPNDDDDCAEDESQLDEISGRARSGRRLSPILRSQYGKPVFRRGGEPVSRQVEP